MKKNWKLNDKNNNFIKYLDEGTNQVSKNYYSLSEIQAKAILDLRLNKLTNLEKNEIIEYFKNEVSHYSAKVQKKVIN